MRRSSVPIPADVPRASSPTSFCFVPAALELAATEARRDLPARFEIAVASEGTALVMCAPRDVADAVLSIVFDLIESVPPGDERGEIRLSTDPDGDGVAIVATLRLEGPAADSAMVGTEAQLARILGGGPSATIVDATRLGARVEWWAGRDIAVRLVLPCAAR